MYGLWEKKPRFIVGGSYVGTLSLFFSLLALPSAQQQPPPSDDPATATTMIRSK